MKFEREEILTIIDKVHQTEMASFEYKDQDVKLKICGKGSAVTLPLRSDQVSDNTAEAKGTEAVLTKHSGSPSSSSESGQITEAREEADYSVYVESPMVGTFYAAPSQDAKPFVQVGDRVAKGQTVGIVEAMKLMNEIEAECGGIVEEILVKNEQMVEYGQKLIRIRGEQ